jgi:hypothetical protein
LQQGSRIRNMARCRRFGKKGGAYRKQMWDMAV